MNDKETIKANPCWSCMRFGSLRVPNRKVIPDTGEIYHVLSNVTVYYVKCGICGQKTESVKSKENAIKMWNEKYGWSKE